MKATKLLTFETLREEVMSRFNESASLPQVPAEEQEMELKYQSRMTGGERFFFVVDLFHFEITHKGGIQRWLGYPESEFSYKQYWTLLHPSSQRSVIMVSQQLYQDLCSGKYPLDFMVQRFSSTVAIKHRNGNYLFAKKISSVFQYDQQNRLLSYINEFTIVGPFRGEGLTPNFYNDMGNEAQKGGEVMAGVIDKFRKMKVFSRQEYQLARISVENPAYTRSRIAEEMGIGVAAVGTYSRRFLEKARNYFQVQFSTVHEAAAFLKTNGLL